MSKIYEYNGKYWKDSEDGFPREVSKKAFDRQENAKSLQDTITEVSSEPHQKKVQEDLKKQYEDRTKKEAAAAKETASKNRQQIGLPPLDEEETEPEPAPTLEQRLAESDQEPSEFIESTTPKEAEKSPEKTVQGLDSIFTDPETAKAWNMLEAESNKEESRLLTEKQDSRRSATIGKMIKDLIDASALLYAANKGIEADLKLRDNNPAYERRLREIESDIETKRRVLARRLGVAKSLFNHQESKAARDEDRTESRNLRAKKEAESEERARAKEIKAQRKQLTKIRQDAAKEAETLLRKGDSESIYKELKDVKGLPEDVAEKLSGKDQGIAWLDTDPDRDLIIQLYTRRKLEEAGFAPQKPSQPDGRKQATYSQYKNGQLNDKDRELFEEALRRAGKEDKIIKK